jgi:hypothetical protein
MTVQELIVLLQQLPNDLPVYLGDWNEQYAYDNPLGPEDYPRVSPAYGPDDGVRRARPPRVMLPQRVVIGNGRRD